MNFFKEQPEKKYSETEDLKNRFIDIALIVGTVLGFAAFIPSLVQALETGFTIKYLSDLIIILLFFIIYLFRKKIQMNLKTVFILIGLFLFIITDFIMLGILSDNKVLIIALLFLAFLVFSIKQSIWWFILITISFIVQAYLHINGTLGKDIDQAERAVSIDVWIVNYLLTAIVSFAIILILRKFNYLFIRLIEDLKKKNKEIVEKESSYTEIFNATSNAIFIHDMNGKILEVNDYMLELYKYDKDQIKGLDIGAFSAGIPPYDNEHAGVFVKEAIDKGKVTFDWSAKDSHGREFWTEVSLKKTTIGGKDRILAIVKDIDEQKRISLELEKYKDNLEQLVKDRTEELEASVEELNEVNEELEASNEDLNKANQELSVQKNEIQITLDKLKHAQQQLIQSEKMASLGVLSAGVAHEINNPLNFILGGVTGLEKICEDQVLSNKEDIKPLISAIKEGVDRAADIVSGLGQFSRQGGSTDEDCDIHKILENCLTILRNKLKHRIQTIKKYKDSSLTIKGNEGKLHQIFLNLLSNAEQSISDEGEIIISTDSDLSFAVICIQDSGTGIKKEHVSMISDPFFTTKEPGEGTGLGLSIVHQIIKEHQGEIEFSSEEDKGTKVTVKLPKTIK